MLIFNAVGLQIRPSEVLQGETQAEGVVRVARRVAAPERHTEATTYKAVPTATTVHAVRA